MCTIAMGGRPIIEKIIGDDIKKKTQSSSNKVSDFVSGAGSGQPSSTGAISNRVKVGASTNGSSRTANTGLGKLRIQRSNSST